MNYFTSKNAMIPCRTVRHFLVMVKVKWLKRIVHQFADQQKVIGEIGLKGNPNPVFP